MSAKHTPGPWKAGKATIRHMVAEISAQIGEATYTIAHVDCVDGGDRDAANARLIAAAPVLADLLEAIADPVALQVLGEFDPKLSKRVLAALKKAGLR